MVAPMSYVSSLSYGPNSVTHDPNLSISYVSSLSYGPSSVTHDPNLSLISGIVAKATSQKIKIKKILANNPCYAQNEFMF